MGNEAQDFVDFLKANVVPWTEDRRTRLGLKLVTIGGDLLRMVQANNEIPFFWDELSKQLPSDFIVIDWGVPWLWPKASATGRRDEYAICFASAEWPVVPDGEIIPELRPILKRSYSLVAKGQTS